MTKFEIFFVKIKDKHNINKDKQIKIVFDFYTNTLVRCITKSVICLNKPCTYYTIKFNFKSSKWFSIFAIYISTYRWKKL